MSQPAPENSQPKRAKTGSLEGVDVQDALRAAAAPDAGQKRRQRLIAGCVALAACGAIAVVVNRLPDPLDGPRPSARLVKVLPAVVSAYQGLAKGKDKAPTPAQVAAAVTKATRQAVPIVGAGDKTPNAVRLGGTAEAPVVEVLDEKGEIAIYGDMPLAISVEVN